MFRNLSLPTVTRLVENHRWREDRIERHSTAQLSFELEVFFVLKSAFAVHIFGEFYERSTSFDFLLPPDAGCFTRRSVQGIARL